MMKTVTVLILATLLVVLMISSVVQGSRPGRRSHCQLAVDRGQSRESRRRASSQRWYYDSQVGECKNFTWTGRGGNENKFLTKSLCERVCRPGCIQRNCSRTCDHGYIVDEQGCTTCSCQPAPEQEFCPSIECPDTSCPRGYQTDSHGCQTCDCIAMPSAPRAERSISRNKTCPPVCYMFCEFGNKRDENGCAICSCKTKEDVCGSQICMMACPLGFVRDSRGCDLCECKSGTAEVSTNCNNASCFKFCPSGFLKDSSGCEICECAARRNRHHQAPDCSNRPLCTMQCTYGFEKGSDGCSTCRCAERTSSRRLSRPKQRHGSKSREDDCGVVAMCTLFCPQGFQKDSRGCNTCACRPDHPVARNASSSRTQTPGNNIPAQLPADVPTQEPPTVDCTAKRCHKRMRCAFGFSKDSFGCDSCVCNSARNRSASSRRRNS